MTLEIILFLSVLAITIFLFISEWLRVDIIAILVMLILAWLKLVKPLEAFSGFASNAVISIIALMILGYGIDRSGIMNRITRPIMRLAGPNEKRLVFLVSLVVGLISAFMQNVGTAALFLPAMVRIARNTRIHLSQLLMPMGFAAILGGTLSMVGSSPLIVLNDLLKQEGIKEFGLFSVTPIGIALLSIGILYFLIFGRIILPKKSKIEESVTHQQKLVEKWQLPSRIYHCFVPSVSPLIGKTRGDVINLTKDKVKILTITGGNDILYAPQRHTLFSEGQRLSLLGSQEEVQRFIADYKLEIESQSSADEIDESSTAGFAEIIIPSRSPIIGKTIKEIGVRQIHGLEPVILLTHGGEEWEDFSDRPLQAGNAILVFGPWENIRSIGDNINFVLVTPITSETKIKPKPITATICLLVAIVLALSGFHLSLALLTGALGMILFRVVNIDEAYKSVDWKTVFLLAGLIPIGIAMNNTGTADYIANQMMRLFHGGNYIVILSAFAILSTLFSLFMSNVAATTLLIPLVMITSEVTGINPRGLALLVGVCASNSFVLPTHQVNALLMSLGGYRNADYIKAGGIMSIIFIIVSVTLIYLFYI